MLFLSSPRGMGIAPIIKLSVVNGTCLPLLFLPRFHGFGTNESQPSGGIDRSRILEWGLCLSQKMCQHIRFFDQKDANILTSLGLITGIASQAQVADSICPAVDFRLDMLNLKRHILGPTVTTSPIPLFEEVLSDFIAKERVVLGDDPADLRFSIWCRSNLTSSRLIALIGHSRLAQVKTFASRLSREGGSHPAFRFRSLNRGFL